LALFCKNHVFHFDSLIKQNILPRSISEKCKVYKDKGEGFPKNLFSILKVDRRHRHRRLKKTANFCINIFKDDFKGTVKKILEFFSFDYGKKHLEFNHTNRKNCIFIFLVVVCRVPVAVKKRCDSNFHGDSNYRADGNSNNQNLSVDFCDLGTTSLNVIP